MSRTWSLVVVDTVVPSIILGLLILLAAHVCASTVLNDLAWLLVLNPRASLLNLLKRYNCAVAVSSQYLLYKEIKYSSTEKKKTRKKKKKKKKKRASFFLKQTVK
jgi:hypothetical protein